MTKKITLKLLDYFITVAEYNEAQRLKMEAIKAKDFENAKKYFDLQLQLGQQLMTLEELKSLRDSIK